MGNCEGCLQRRRNPDRPAVAMPMAERFNKKVAVDLKVLGKKNILYMIDMWSRLNTILVIIERKRPQDVVDAMCKHWITYFGTPAAERYWRRIHRCGEGGDERIAQHRRHDNCSILSLAEWTPGDRCNAGSNAKRSP